MSRRVTFRTVPLRPPRPAARGLVVVPDEQLVVEPRPAAERPSRLRVGHLGPLTENQAARQLVAAVLAQERRNLRGK